MGLLPSMFPGTWSEHPTMAAYLRSRAWRGLREEIGRDMTPRDPFWVFKELAPDEVIAVVLVDGEPDGEDFISPDVFQSKIVPQIPDNYGLDPSTLSIMPWVRRSRMLLLRTCMSRAGAAPRSHASLDWDSLLDAVLRTVASGMEDHIPFLALGPIAEERIRKSVDLGRHAVFAAPALEESRFALPVHSVNAYLRSNGRSPLRWRCE